MMLKHSVRSLSLLGLTLFIVLIVVACGTENDDSPPFIEDPIGDPFPSLHEVDNVLPNGEEDEEEIEAIDEADDDLPADPPSAEPFVCPEVGEIEVKHDYLRVDLLCRGIIHGLDVQIGHLKTEMKEKLGEPSESGYYDGGFYDAYDVGDASVLYFGEDESEIEHVWLIPHDRVSLETVREALGEAVVDRHVEEDDAFDEWDEYSEWFLFYEFGPFTLRVYGEDDEHGSRVIYFFLKQEPKHR